MTLLAHSRQSGREEQEYPVHVRGTWDYILKVLEEMKHYMSVALYDRVWRRLFLAAVFHDIGKLCEDDQRVLKQSGTKKKLPVPHQYAGAYLLHHTYKDVFAAALVYGHHRPGLPDLNEEIASDVSFCPENGGDFSKKLELEKRIHKELPYYLESHNEAVPDLRADLQVCEKPTPLEERISLSMLVDGDWSNTAGEVYCKVPVRWSERLEQIDLKKKIPHDKNSSTDMESLHKMFVHDFYEFCREKSNIHNCCQYYEDLQWEYNILAPFLHLLRCAKEHNLRHIVMVFPQEEMLHFVDSILKETIVLPGENKDEVVAAIYRQIEYSSYELRKLAISWEAPIILTTADNFFETLSSNLPSKLRKLHHLPGSAVFIGGYSGMFTHAFLPLVWKWIRELTYEWGCYTLLASDAAVKFYEFEDYLENFNLDSTDDWPIKLVPDEERMHWPIQQNCSLHIAKKDLPEFRFDKVEAFLDFMLQKPGPRIIVVDNPLTSATIAYKLRQRQEEVYHLSEAFTVNDKCEILKGLEEKFKIQGENNEWTLVTTNFTGLDLRMSFRSGFFRVSSCEALIQCVKCINRNDKYSAGDLWIFALDDPDTPRNKKLDIHSEILYELISDGIEQKEFRDCSLSELATYAFTEYGKRQLGGINDLLISEDCGEFKTIAQRFSFMYNRKESIGVTDKKLINQVTYGRKVINNEIQKKCVPLDKELIEYLQLKEVSGCPGIYYLSEEKYDADLLGCYKSLMK
ncbi:MAG: hypothetical protein Q4D16_01840 [Eubacteriales bacterium]|nr:hypothetical protein [Eubacteriales bacterium]